MAFGDFEMRLFPELRFENIYEWRKFWFAHIYRGTNASPNLFLSNAIWLFQFLIWEAKLLKKTPSMITLMQDFIYNLGNTYDHSVGVRYDFEKLSQYAIYREWGRLRHG